MSRGVGGVVFVSDPSAVVPVCMSGVMRTPEHPIMVGECPGAPARRSKKGGRGVCGSGTTFLSRLETASGGVDV